MISGIVLAAGKSSRLGRPKQLLQLDGRPLLQHVIDALGASRVDEVVVVLGHEANAIRAALELPAGARVVVNTDYAGGQSTSLRAGVAAVDPRSEACVVVLGDQPSMTAELVDAAVAAWRASDRPVARAVFGGTPGHPVVVARSHWGTLSAARGDEGGRGMLAHPSVPVAEIEMGAALDDVDSWEDFERLRARSRVVEK